MSTLTERPPAVTAGRHAMHAARAATPWWRLLLRFAVRVKLQYLLDAPATHAWLILMRKYDAFTTDFAYDTTPRSWLGPLGHAAARRVMNYPIHVALRERLALVVAALVEAVEQRQGTARVLSAPCGLCRDLLTAARQLGERGTGVVWHALDLDARGDVIPEARRRAAAAGVPVQFYREDLLDPARLVEHARPAPYDVVNCIGLTAWLTLEQVERLLRLFHDAALHPGGTLLIDNWARHAHSQAGEDLEIFAEYHPPAAFRAALERAGFAIEREQTVSNGACTLSIATAR